MSDDEDKATYEKGLEESPEAVLQRLSKNMQYKELREAGETQERHKVCAHIMNAFRSAEQGGNVPVMEALANLFGNVNATFMTVDLMRLHIQRYEATQKMPQEHKTRARA